MTLQNSLKNPRHLIKLIEKEKYKSDSSFEENLSFFNESIIKTLLQFNNRNNYSLIENVLEKEEPYQIKSNVVEFERSYKTEKKEICLSVEMEKTLEQYLSYQNDKLEASSCTIDENIVNEERKKEIMKKFNDDFIKKLKECDFEYGIYNELDKFFSDNLKMNSFVTKECLNELFLKYYSNEEVVVGILRVISRINYDEIKPVGQTLAMAALVHKNIIVVETAIRAFENWGKYEAIEYLKKVKIAEKWLNTYYKNVIKYLSDEQKSLN